MTLRPRLAKILGGTTVALLLLMLLFRFAIYRHMYKAPNDPYGISDVIEFLLGCVLALSVVVSVLGAITLLVKGPRENRVAAVWLLVTCGAVFGVADPLHSLAARFAL